jgi:hypothetical protein
MATYDELLAELPNFVDRDYVQDAKFAASVPRFFDSAQRRIVREVNLTAFHRETAVADFTPGGALVPRPADAVTFVYFEVRASSAESAEWMQIKWANVGFVKEYRTFTSSRALPRYVCLFDASNLAVAPNPDTGHQYRIGYRAIDAFLGPAVQTNLLSLRYPDLLLHALILEAVKFGKEDKAENQAELAKWEAAYGQIKRAAVANEIASGAAAYENAIPVEQA